MVLRPIPMVGVVLAVRNEAESLESVLAALNQQTLLPSVVVVVDDGSTDTTPQLLSRVAGAYGFELRVVRLPSHEARYNGRPELGGVINSGLSVVRAHHPPVAYVMKVDGDHILPRNYTESIVERMEANPRLAVASGHILGEQYTATSPRGTGMVVRAGFWNEADGMKFPLIYGWESWLNFKAMQMGYETRSFREVTSRVTRPTRKKGAALGRTMYAIGFTWPAAVWSCLRIARRSLRTALEVFYGYVDRRGVEKADISVWVGDLQKRNLLRRFAHPLRHKADAPESVPP